MRHIISVRDFTTEDLFRIFRLVRQNKHGRKFVDHLPLEHRILATLFYEASTRTRLSFEAAMLRLGGRVISTENAKEFSSAAKGETLEDTVRVVSSYCDVIALRHPENWAGERAAKVTCVPLINAGDGDNEHPTQALLDLFTIWDERDTLPREPLHIVCFGDNLHSRAVHSFLLLLVEHADALEIPIGRITFSGIAGRSNPNVVFLEELKESGVEIGYSNLTIPLDGDVYYLTRLQRERGGPSAEIIPLREAGCDNFEAEIMNSDVVEKLKKHAMILHPLPRTNDLSSSVDTYPQARYFEQVKNGLYVRMALLEFLLK